MALDDKSLYDDTVDVSREASMQKALTILYESMEADKPPLYRPDVNPRRGIIKIIAVLICSVFLLVLSFFFDIPWYFSIAFLAVFAAVFAKKTALWLILLYQKYAPEKMRRACVFVPTCSEYMSLAIKKYGLLRGLIKGVKRLLRCHYPNGGVDNP